MKSYVAMAAQVLVLRGELKNLMHVITEAAHGRHDSPPPLSVSLMFIVNQSRKVEHSVSLWLTPPWWFWPKQATRSTRWPVRSSCSTEPWLCHGSDSQQTYHHQKTFFFKRGRRLTTKMLFQEVQIWDHVMEKKRNAALFQTPNEPSLWATGSNRQQGEASLCILICGMGGGWSAG